MQAPGISAHPGASNDGSGLRLGHHNWSARTPWNPSLFISSHFPASLYLDLLKESQNVYFHSDNIFIFTLSVSNECLANI